MGRAPEMGGFWVNDRKGLNSGKAHRIGGDGICGTAGREDGT